MFRKAMAEATFATVMTEISRMNPRSRENGSA